jgi:protein SCO1
MGPKSVAMQTRPRSSATLALCLVLIAGCRREGPKPEAAEPPPKAAEPATTTVTYKLVGVVARVNKDAGQVLIRHEAIPGFMDAMTMPFSIKDRDLLDDLRPGDEVEGPLRVVKRGDEVTDYELTDLAVTKPAPGPSLTLSLAGGEPKFVPATRPLEPGQEVPDFAMTTQEGKPLRLSDLRGEVVVLTFIYTRCPLPDFCPLIDRKFAELADRLGNSPRRAEHVRLLSVSFDPEHDTPEVLAKFARVQGAKPPLWTFAVAPHDELAKVAGAVGLSYGPRPDEIIHNLTVAVIDPSGKLARLFVGAAAKTWTAADLIKLVDEAGRGG